MSTIQQARLKEFAEQAGFSLLDIHHAFEYDVNNEFKEFARLVAQDCISQIAILGVTNFENDDVLWTVDRAVESIKERYGVK